MLEIVRRVVFVILFDVILFYSSMKYHSDVLQEVEDISPLEMIFHFQKEGQ